MFRSAMLQSNRVVVSAGGWTPASLPNVVSWWRAQDEPTGVMSSWTDLSGNGNHLTQATAAKKPINTASQINGKAAVIFDGVDDFLQATFTLNQPTEVWLVFKQISWTSIDRVFDGAPGINTMSLEQQTASGTVGLRCPTQSVTNSDATVGAFSVAQCLFDGASSTLTIDNGTTATGNPGTNNAGGFTLGAYGSGTGRYGNVAIADIFILSAASAAAEKTDIYTYLNAQYGWAL